MAMVVRKGEKREVRGERVGLRGTRRIVRVEAMNGAVSFVWLEGEEEVCLFSCNGF